MDEEQLIEHYTEWARGNKDLAVVHMRDAVTLLKTMSGDVYEALAKRTEAAANTLEARS